MPDEKSRSEARHKGRLTPRAQICRGVRPRTEACVCVGAAHGGSSRCFIVLQVLSLEAPSRSADRSREG